MLILLVHNYYQYPGGEDQVFRAERQLLIDHGHKVISYTDTNLRINSINPLQAFKQSIWSNFSYNALKEIIMRDKPDLAHFHNTFLLISPSAYDACIENEVPVIQSLHNYRLICPAATFYRNEMPCEDCMGKVIPYPGIIHKCYRNSYSHSFLSAAVHGFHNIRKTWWNRIDEYIVSTDFSKKKMVDAGLPLEKINIKPNFTTDYGVDKENSKNYALFIGRLSSEKGIRTLLDAWSGRNNIPLLLAGDGPLRKLIEEQVTLNQSIRYQGFLEKTQVINLVRNAKFLLVPSHCYEVFPISILEAFSCGTPVIASRLGALVEIVKEGETGLLFEPGNAGDLEEKTTWLWSHPREAEKMGRAARQEYESKYTPTKNYSKLIEIYQKTMVTNNQK